VALSSVFTVVFSKIIGIVFEFVVRLLLVNVSITSDKMIRDIDKFLVDTSKNTDICQSSTKKPTNSFHIRFIGYGFIIAVRTSTTNYRGSSESYMIHGTKLAVEKLQGQIGDTDTKIAEVLKLKISNFESTGPWNTSFITADEEPYFATAFSGQELCIEKIATSKSIFLCGEPGVGKTNVALFLAKKLTAQLVFGYDLTAPGVSLDDLWRLCPSENAPVILVLDEIDGAFACANANNRAKEHRCLAQNKTALNTLFDRFERTKHLIILATSNKRFSELVELYPSYIRKGRFDSCFTLTTDDCVVETN
jgi:hypothetical protein